MVANEQSYVIISPVRNEAKHIKKTINSVLNQDLLPKEWIIVNDGSTDDTYDILCENTKNYEWIKVINLPDRGYHEPGKGVIDSFYIGYNNLEFKNYNFIVKLDGDLSFPSLYFNDLLECFLKNPRLGIAGGICYIFKNNKLLKESHPRFHVRGPTKVYRRECWDQIGGLVNHLGWDTIDEIHAQYLGWETTSFPQLKLIHYKPTGLKSGTFNWSIKLGKADYYCGYHPIFALAKSCNRFFKPPLFIGGFGILCGYLYSLFLRQPRYSNLDIIKYIRKEQIKYLTFRNSLWSEV